jgi:hypothetical protein
MSQPFILESEQHDLNDVIPVDPGSSPGGIQFPGVTTIDWMPGKNSGMTKKNKSSILQEAHMKHIISTAKANKQAL